MHQLIRIAVLYFASVTYAIVFAGQEHAPDVLKVETAQVPMVQTFDGTVEAENRSTVSAQTSGRIIEIHYDIDDFVEKGAVLISLNDVAQWAEQDRARGHVRCCVYFG